MMKKGKYTWEGPNAIYETNRFEFYAVKANDFGFGFKVCKTKASGEIPSYIWLRIQVLKYVLHFVFAVKPKSKYQPVSRKE